MQINWDKVITAIKLVRDTVFLAGIIVSIWKGYVTQEQFNTWMSREVAAIWSAPSPP